MNTTMEYNNNSKNVICTYDDYVIFEESGKQFFKDLNDQTIKEVVLVKSIPVDLENDIAENDLIDPAFEFDVSGELDNERIYCYWKYTE